MPFGDGHEEIALKKQVLLLKVVFNGSDVPPEKWHWDELLGLADHESIELLMKSDIVDVDAEDYGKLQ